MSTAREREMAHRRPHAAAHEEEHENHERWLITYADMITLLMVLFIVLFSIGQVDLAKFEALKHSLANSLGGPAQPNPVVQGGAGVLTAGSQIDGAVPGASGSSGSPVQSSEASVALVREQAKAAAAAAEEQATLQNAEQTIKQALAGRGLQDAVTFRQELRGLVVTVVTDNVLYKVGSAVLQPEGRGVLDALGPALAKLPNDISVEGHTDNQPIIPGGTYPSNWELSTARATAVVRYLIDVHHLAPDRLSAAGFADTRPLVPNTSPANQALNRRVEIVILNLDIPSSQTGAA
jgi:chemotaxis protein MotB